jgi:hypothetical protein
MLTEVMKAALGDHYIKSILSSWERVERDGVKSALKTEKAEELILSPSTVPKKDGVFGSNTLTNGSVSRTDLGDPRLVRFAALRSAASPIRPSWPNCRTGSPKFSFPRHPKSKLKKPSACAKSFISWLRIPDSNRGPND